MFTNLKKVVISFFKSLLINRKLNTYFFFFAVAFSFWFLNMLSKKHETTFFIPINYINHPADLIALDSDECGMPRACTWKKSIAQNCQGAVESHDQTKLSLIHI